MQGVDTFIEAVWKVWVELLEVLGLDGRYGDGRAGCWVTCFCFGVQPHCVGESPCPQLRVHVRLEGMEDHWSEGAFYL